MHPGNRSAEILGGRIRHGWFIYASEDLAAPIPDDLRAVMRLARQRDREYLPLGCDALPLVELPVLHPDYPGASSPV